MNKYYVSVVLLVISLIFTVSCGGSSKKNAALPSIVSISPASAQADVLRNAPVIITFSTALDSSVKGSVELLSSSTSFSAGEISVSGSTVTVDPDSDFSASTTYTGISIEGFRDIEGRVMADYKDAAYHFTTGVDADTVPPSILSIAPADGSGTVDRNSNIVITFSEPLGAAIGSVAITSPALTFSSSEISISGSAVTINPASDFDASQKYTGLSVSGFKDVSGNTMIAYADSGYDFTTSAAVATAASDVTFTVTDNTHGTLTVSRSVALACTTPSAVLRVTTDGTAPTRTNGSTYSSALKIDTDTTVRAFAYCDGLTDSAETSRVLSFSVPLSNHVADWRDESIYFMMTDRFNDGDSLNNSQMSSSFDGGDYDAGDGKKYQGGDFAGVTEKLDYLHNLGISAIWITSPVKQAWNNAGYTSYHGYWAQDFMSVDPHLGTMEDFRVMVYEAHSRGIKVIMDVVVNHAGSLFYYDIDGDGTADSGEWEPSYLEAGYNKAYLTWLEGSDWADAANRKKPMPVEFQNPAWWSLCGGNATSGTGTNEVLYGDFAGLRDINTANADVRAKFKEIFKWWIVNTDIDGIRIDTVKHVETSFWADFCAEMRTWAKSSEGGNKNFYMLAEVYDGSAAGLGTFTVNNMLDSVLGFHMADEVFDWNSGDNVTVFKDAGTWSTRPKTSAIESALSSITSIAALNADSIHTNGDGLTARQKIGYFIDNHDLNRFLNGTSDTANAAASSGEVKNLQAALSWLLTWEGLPVIYYGTEQNYKQSLALTNHGEMGDGAGNCEKGNRPRLWMVANSNNGSAAFDESNATFKLIQGLLSLRTTYPELSRGEVSIKWTDSGDGVTNDDGILAFVRKGDTATVDDDVLVVINTHPSQASAASAGSGNDMGTDWSVGTVLKTVAIPGFDSSQPTVNNGASDVIEVTTFAQTGKTSAVYFKVPAASVRIFVKK